MAAKYYIYRNLHTKTFSVRYRGRVIAHPLNFMASKVQFKVNQKGHQRVLIEHRKNVHAFIVCESWVEIAKEKIYAASGRIYYNPYNQSQFISSNKPIIKADKAFGLNGQNLYLKLFGIKGK